MQVVALDWVSKSRVIMMNSCVGWIDSVCMDKHEESEDPCLFLGAIAPLRPSTWPLTALFHPRISPLTRLQFLSIVVVNG